MSVATTLPAAAPRSESAPSGGLLLGLIRFEEALYAAVGISSPPTTIR